MDDDFVAPDYENGNEVIDTDRVNLWDDVNLAKKYNLILDPAENYEEFERKFKDNPDKYQAVILDIMDLNPLDSSDETPMIKAVNLVKRHHGTMIFIYSSNIDKQRAFLEVSLPKENVVNKIDPVETLYDKIVKALDNELHYFSNHQECLELFSKGYLNTLTQMKAILKNYKDISYLPFNDMRQVLENMLETMVQAGVITATTGGDTCVTFNNRMKFLTTEVNKLPNGKPNWIDPKFPYKDCCHEIKWVLDFLGNISNRYSHYQKTHPDFLLSGQLLTEYSESIREITYGAFFVAMKWYHGYMTTKFG